MSSRFPWADSVSPRMDTIASHDQFKLIRIGENLLENYHAYQSRANNLIVLHKSTSRSKLYLYPLHRHCKNEFSTNEKSARHGPVNYRAQNTWTSSVIVLVALLKIAVKPRSLCIVHQNISQLLNEAE